MDGKDSDLFRYFRTLVVRGFEEVRKRYERIVSLVEMLLPGLFTLRTLTPCFVCFHPFLEG